MMRAIIISAALVACALLASSTEVAAVAFCVPHDAIASQLAETYNESVTWYGVAGMNLMEMFENEKTGTWTIAITSGRGLTCVIASGTDSTRKPKGEEDETNARN